MTDHWNFLQRKWQHSQWQSGDFFSTYSITIWLKVVSEYPVSHCTIIYSVFPFFYPLMKTPETEDIHFIKIFLTWKCGQISFMLIEWGINNTTLVTESSTLSINTINLKTTSREIQMQFLSTLQNNKSSFCRRTFWKLR